MARSRASRPRGAGTYWARVYCECVDHGRHDVIISAADDDSWVVAQWLAHTLHQNEHAQVRCLVWHVRERWSPPSAADITADQIEDDVPF